MNELKQDNAQRFVISLDALRRLVDDRGHNNNLTADEIWAYSKEELASKYRPIQIKALIEAGYLERTDRRTNARSPSRRGNLVDVLKPGLRLKRDKLPPILFYCLTARAGLLPAYAVFPCMTLIPLRHRDGDYQSDISSIDMNESYKTAFELRYYSNNTTDPILLGIVKILQLIEGKIIEGRVRHNTPLPSVFAVLDSQFISLGQSVDYYKQLKSLEETVYEPVFSGLNDVVFHQDFDTSFKSDLAWRVSLLRFSEAEKAYREARDLFHLPPTYNRQPSETFKFTFTCKVPGAVGPHKVSFDFRDDPTGLNRIAALIGRNGTGKTQVLAKLANALSGLRLDMGQFEPERPSFSKVIAISYSIFDEFERPLDDETSFSYIYCGVRQKERQGERLLTQDQIRDKLFDITDAIQKTDRYVRWREIITPLLDETPLPEGDIIIENYQGFYDKLSSGKRILILIMSEVIQNIADDSIILFDEPELHLHPEAIAGLTRSLHKLLDQFSSYAIIATHSPIILQEIPAKFVTVFERHDTHPEVSPLRFESFGENLSNITDEVFGTIKERYNYREHLRELAKRNTYKDILDMFDNRLSFNARAFLGTLYTER